MQNKSQGETFARTISHAILLTSLSLLTLLFPGCGGRTNQVTSTGRVQLTIEWPAASRYIPSYAASIIFEMYLKADPTKRYQIVANRPDSRPSTQTVEFNALIPSGIYVLAGAARADTGGQGATVATALTELQVQPGGVTGVDLTFKSTIKTIEIQGQPLRLPVGTQVILTGRALDPDGKVILLPAGALTWSLVSGTQFGSITEAGLFKAMTPGTARVRLAETGAAITAEADVSVVASGGGGLDNSSWPKAHADLLNSGRSGTGPTADGTLRWKLDGVETGESPAIAPDGSLYVVKDDRIVQLDPATGAVKWQSDSVGHIVSGLTIGEDGALYGVITPIGEVDAIAVDRTTGIRKWATPIDTDASQLRPPTVGSNGLVYIQAGKPSGQPGGLVYALDRTNGSIRWQTPYGGAYGFGVTIGPDGTLYTAGDNGWFYALDGATGAKKWQNQTWLRYNIPAIGSTGDIYANVYRGSVRAFSAATGEKIWDTDIGRGRIADVPLAVGPNGTIYTGTNNYPGDGARVTALNATTGTIKWSVVLEGFNVSGIALATDGTLFITAQNTTKLTALNPVDGAIKWEYTHGGFSPSAPSVGPDGTVYFTSGSNAGTTLYAVK